MVFVCYQRKNILGYNIDDFRKVCRKKIKKKEKYADEITHKIERPERTNLGKFKYQSSCISKGLGTQGSFQGPMIG